MEKNRAIEQLQPTAVWQNFKALTQIPRPSGKRDLIAKYLVDFGKNLGLESFEDEAGNVIIRKPATPGLENLKGVILQGHMDMEVALKNVPIIQWPITIPIRESGMAASITKGTVKF